MADSTPNLRTLFDSAQRQQGILGSHSETNSGRFQEQLEVVIDLYESSEKVADRLALFSHNESLDDVSSRDLPYLSIAYHLAELILQRHGSDRRMILVRARQEYDRYLDLLDAYGVLSASDKKLYEEFQGKPDSFSTASTVDPAARRHAKITRFKYEKELKQKLEHLTKGPGVLAVDDSVLRSVNLTQLNLYIHQTFAALEAIAQELQILSLAPAEPPIGYNNQSQDLRERQGRVQRDDSEKLDPPISQLLNQARSGAILDQSGKPLQPFTLLGNRDHLRQGVFRAGHNLPTMTIDEYLEEEKRRGGIIEGGGEQSGRRPEPDEDNMDRADEETMQAREWDEFKEANPKGAGNTMNRG